MGAWLVLAKDASKRIGEGYDDDPASHYSWDSKVPNHAALRVGDVIALWDAQELLGVSVIEDIILGEAERRSPYCLACGKADVSERKTKQPRYRCWTSNCKYESAEVGWKSQKVVTYRTRHEAGWTPTPGALTRLELQMACVQPNSQNSLRELREDEFREALEYAAFPVPLRVLDSVRESAVGGHARATVRVRRGQPAFRRKLLETFGEVCAFTGPAPVQALEAAHLYSYAAKGKHYTGGGLLLRRDLHRLFDLGQVAVDPQERTLHVSEALVRYPDYARLHGADLSVPLADSHVKWLVRHWEMHRGGGGGVVPGCRR